MNLDSRSAATRGGDFYSGRPIGIKYSAPLQRGICRAVGQRGGADRVMPMFHLHLTGDDGRAYPVAVIEDLQLIPTALHGQGGERPAVDDQDIRLRQLRQRLGIAAITAPYRQRRE